LLTRVGLHCAPIAHRSLGTFPEGTVRFGWGPFTREGDVRAAVRALRTLAGERR
jgi:selenocysteine lyase/cysteine desulfurase